MHKAEVMVPGSCGELAQGLLNNNNLMITCPINLFSRVSVVIDKNTEGIKMNIPAGKTFQAVEKLLKYLKKDNPGVRITISSQLKRGKGMASSTADITGALAALMIALGNIPDLNLIKKIALEVEPTDGVFLPGINLFDHIEGKIAHRIGEPPELDILVFFENGEMDTITFNNIEGLREKKKAKEKLVMEAVNYITRGIKTKNNDLIGKGATLSTIAHQRILYKDYLGKLLHLIDNKRGIYGINTAHSGNLIGIIVHKEGSYEKLIKSIRREIPLLNYYKRVKIISGGIHYLKGEVEYDPCSRWKHHGSKAEV